MLENGKMREEKSKFFLSFFLDLHWFCCCLWIAPLLLSSMEKKQIPWWINEWTSNNNEKNLYFSIISLGKKLAEREKRKNYLFHWLYRRETRRVLQIFSISFFPSRARFPRSLFCLLFLVYLPLLCEWCRFPWKVLFQIIIIRASEMCAHLEQNAPWTKSNNNTRKQKIK